MEIRGRNEKKIVLFTPLRLEKMGAELARGLLIHFHLAQEVAHVVAHPELCRSTFSMSGRKKKKALNGANCPDNVAKQLSEIGVKELAMGEGGAGALALPTDALALGPTDLTDQQQAAKAAGARGGGSLSNLYSGLEEGGGSSSSSSAAVSSGRTARQKEARRAPLVNSNSYDEELEVRTLTTASEQEEQGMEEELEEQAAQLEKSAALAEFLNAGGDMPADFDEVEESESGSGVESGSGEEEGEEMGGKSPGGSPGSRKKKRKKRVSPKKKRERKAMEKQQKKMKEEVKAAFLNTASPVLARQYKEINEKYLHRNDYPLGGEPSDGEDGKTYDARKKEEAQIAAGMPDSSDAPLPEDSDQPDTYEDSSSDDSSSDSDDDMDREKDSDDCDAPGPAIEAAVTPGVAVEKTASKEKSPLKPSKSGGALPKGVSKKKSGSKSKANKANQAAQAIGGKEDPGAASYLAVDMFDDITLDQGPENLAAVENAFSPLQAKEAENPKGVSFTAEDGLLSMTASAWGSFEGSRRPMTVQSPAASQMQGLSAVNVDDLLRDIQKERQKGKKAKKEEAGEDEPLSGSDSNPSGDNLAPQKLESVREQIGTNKKFRKKKRILPHQAAKKPNSIHGIMKKYLHGMRSRAGDSIKQHLQRVHSLSLLDKIVAFGRTTYMNKNKRIVDPFEKALADAEEHGGSAAREAMMQEYSMSNNPFEVIGRAKELDEDPGGKKKKKKKGADRFGSREENHVHTIPSLAASASAPDLLGHGADAEPRVPKGPIIGPPRPAKKPRKKRRKNNWVSPLVVKAMQLIKDEKNGVVPAVSKSTATNTFEPNPNSKPFVDDSTASFYGSFPYHGNMAQTAHPGGLEQFSPIVVRSQASVMSSTNGFDSTAKGPIKATASSLVATRKILPKSKAGPTLVEGEENGECYNKEKSPSSPKRSEWISPSSMGRPVGGISPKASPKANQGLLRKSISAEEDGDQTTLLDSDDNLTLVTIASSSAASSALVHSVVKSKILDKVGGAAGVTTASGNASAPQTENAPAEDTDAELVSVSRQPTVTREDEQQVVETSEEPAAALPTAVIIAAASPIRDLDGLPSTVDEEGGTLALVEEELARPGTPATAARRTDVTEEQQQEPEQREEEHAEAELASDEDEVEENEFSVAPSSPDRVSSPDVSPKEKWRDDGEKEEGEKQEVQDQRRASNTSDVSTILVFLLLKSMIQVPKIYQLSSGVASKEKPAMDRDFRVNENLWNAGEAAAEVAEQEASATSEDPSSLEHSSASSCSASSAAHDEVVAQEGRGALEPHEPRTAFSANKAALTVETTQGRDEVEREENSEELDEQAQWYNVELFF